MHSISTAPQPPETAAPTQEAQDKTELARPVVTARPPRSPHANPTHTPRTVTHTPTSATSTDPAASREGYDSNVEHGTGHTDTSTLLLSELNPELSDDLLPPVLPPPRQEIATFTAAHFPHKTLPRDHPDIQARIQAVDESLDLLRQLAAGHTPARFRADPEAAVQALLARFPSPDDFKAGGWSRYTEVWNHLLGPHKHTRQNVRYVLQSLSEGASWELVPPTSQTSMPDVATKLARVRAKLTHLVGPARAEQMLNSSTPHHVRFPNHRSVLEHADFVTTTVKDLLRSGAAMQLPPGQVPMVVNSIGVADNKEKLRLIVDPCYPNLLLRYHPLRYEQVTDLPQYATPHDWATSTDEKSGYYHQALSPSMWSLLGFEWQGIHYVFTHMPFGVAPACRTYTLLKQELFRVIRCTGNVRMTFLIDDQVNVAHSREAAACQAAAILGIQWALGFTLSLHKCVLTPTQLIQFLGLIVDLKQQRFLLPQQKVRAFRDLVAAIEASPQVTARMLAQAAGRLISFAPAVGLSPLYARAVYHVMTGKSKWDALFDTPAEVVQALRWVADHLDAWNGHKWASTRDVLLVAGDYSSDRGYAAFTPNREIPDPVIVSLTPAEQALIAANRLSSTYGELKVVLLTLEVLATHFPSLVQGRLLHYRGDNQAAMTVAAKMAGNATNFPVVRAIWELAQAHNIHLHFEWMPREAEQQAAADALSKLTDNSQWALNDQVYITYIASNPLVRRLGGVTIDLFADNVYHKAPRFMSRHWCPGTEGVNAFHRANWATHPTTGARELAYINGDFSAMGQILHKVIRDKADCVIVYPDWPRYWQVLWQQLPVRQCFQLPRRPDLCIKGCRVNVRKGHGRPPKYPIRVAIIVWDRY